MNVEILGEDEYWENVRERLESRYTEPEPEIGYMFLDYDMRFAILSRYRAAAEDLSEWELMDYVRDETGIEPCSAEYETNGSCIKYSYMP